MAYGEEYWRRWGKRECKPRGRPKRARGADVAGTAAASGTTTAGATAAEAVAGATAVDGVCVGAGCGDRQGTVAAGMTARVTPEGTPSGAWERGGRGSSGAGSSRGGRSGRGRGQGGMRERRGAAAVMWSPVAHRAYERRFERGEGGGVT